MMLLSNLLWSHKVEENQEQFLNKVRCIAEKMLIDPDWLMHVMYFESRLYHKAQNKYSNATGLIQFMPRTAAHLGTAIPSLLAMSNVEQLDYVYAYLKPYKGKMKKAIDVYFAVFFPAAMDKPSDWIIQTRNLPASLIAKQNPVFDQDNNEEITVGEVENVIFKSIPSQYKSTFQNA